MNHEGFLKRIFNRNLLVVLLLLLHAVMGLDNSTMLWTACETATLRRLGVTREESTRLVGGNVADYSEEQAPRATINGIIQCAWVNTTITGVTSSVRVIRVASYETDVNGTQVFRNKNMVWSLVRGPGIAETISFLVKVWQTVAYSFDCGTVDTSGIGYGSDGDCILPESDGAKVVQCLALPKARLYSIDRAVDEVVAVMNLTVYEKHAVLASDAATIILKRMLQRYPNSLQWAIFEGIFTKYQSTKQTSLDQEKQANVFVERCLEEESCKKLFDFYGGARAVTSSFSKMDNRCVREIMVNKEGLKTALMRLAYRLGDDKKLIMATVLRFARCGKRDYNWLKNLYGVWLPIMGLGDYVKPKTRAGESRKARLTFSYDVHYYQSMEILTAKNDNVGNMTWRTNKCEDQSFFCFPETGYQDAYRLLNGTIKGNSVLYQGSGNYTGIAVGFAGDLDFENLIEQARDWKNDYNTTGRNWFIELKGAEQVVGPTVKLVNGKIVNLGPQILAECLKANATIPLNETRVREIFAESLLANYKSFEFRDYFRKIIGMSAEEPLFDETYQGNDWEKSTGLRSTVGIKMLGAIASIAMFLCW